MKPRNEHDVAWDDAFWEVNQAATRLTQYACEVGARCLSDGMLRMQFAQEMAYVGKSIVEDVRSGEKTPEEGLNAIRIEYQSLFEDFGEYSKLVMGLAAGVLQVVGGIAICRLSVGFACATGGMALIQHGVNAIYENGRNLVERRTDTVGPLRKGYQELAKAMGGKASQGNAVYGVMDIVLSVYGVRRLVISPSARKLFRYLRSDKVRAFKTMGRGLIIFELGVNVMTGELVWVEWNKDE